jgi:hypothetical protein
MLKINLADWREAPSEPEQSPPPIEPPREESFEDFFAEEPPVKMEEIVFTDLPVGEAAAKEEQPALEEAPPKEAETPPEEDYFSDERREQPKSEKVTISTREQSVGPELPAIPPPPLEDEPSEPAAPAEKKPSRVLTAVLVVILLAAAGYGAYTQKNRILGLFAGKPKPVPAAPAKPSAPAPAAPQAARPDSTPSSAKAATVPDPTLAALEKIIAGAPDRVLLNYLTVSPDGAYEVSGISFSYEAMKAFSDTLGTMGTVTKASLPSRRAAPDSAYTFQIAGKIAGIGASGKLDAIPADHLAALADSLKSVGKKNGIAIRLPRGKGNTRDSDPSFEAEGGYGEIRAILGELTLGGTLAVYRITIRPASSGPPLDRVRANFSLRAASPI